MKWTSGSSFILNNEVTGDSEESKLITYVPQAKSLSFPYTVEEVVMMGRAKHIGNFLEHRETLIRRLLKMRWIKWVFTI